MINKQHKFKIEFHIYRNLLLLKFKIFIIVLDYIICFNNFMEQIKICFSY